MSVADLIRAMRAAGVPAEKILDTVEAMEEERLAKGRLRQAKHRNSKKNSNVTSVTQRYERDTLSSPEVSPQTPLPNHSNPIPTSPPKGGSSPTDRAIEVFREQAKPAGLAVPRIITADRRRKIEARLREHGEEVWAEACRKMAASSFCRGENDRGWRADLDFLLQPKSFNRLIEGGYDDRPAHRPTAPPPQPSAPRTVGELALHRLQTGQLRDEPSSYSNGCLDPGDGRRQVESHRGAQLITLATAAVTRSG